MIAPIGNRVRGCLGPGLVLGAALALAGCAAGGLGGLGARAADTAAGPRGEAAIVTTALPDAAPPPDAEETAPETAAARPGGQAPAEADEADARAALAAAQALPELARRPPPRRAAARAVPPEAPRPPAADATSAPPAAPTLPTPTTVFGQQAQRHLQDQCARSGGRIGRRGASDALTCFIQPKDAGQRCTRASDCEGACLARSGTCSPVIPLLGCNEILLDTGLRVTECRE